TGALQILSYVSESRTLRITYLRGSGLELYAFADSSYAGDVNDRRSVSGGAIMFGSAAVSWFSRTQ
ncbi:unnamed protein product, partial [Discosporangium mesarthrocarpum]